MEAFAGCGRKKSFNIRRRCSNADSCVLDISIGRDCTTLQTFAFLFDNEHRRRPLRQCVLSRIKQDTLPQLARFIHVIIHSTLITFAQIEWLHRTRNRVRFEFEIDLEPFEVRAPASLNPKALRKPSNDPLRPVLFGVNRQPICFLLQISLFLRKLNLVLGSPRTLVNVLPARPAFVRPLKAFVQLSLSSCNILLVLAQRSTVFLAGSGLAFLVGVANLCKRLTRRRPPRPVCLSTTDLYPQNGFALGARIRSVSLKLGWIVQTRPVYLIRESRIVSFRCIRRCGPKRFP